MGAREWAARPALVASAEPDRRGEHGVGNPERVDQEAGLAPRFVAQPVDLAGDRLTARAGEAAVLLEEAAVVFEVRHRVQVAEPVEGADELFVLAGRDRAHEGLENQAVDVGAGRVDGMVLDGAEDLERVVALASPRLKRLATEAMI